LAALRSQRRKRLRLAPERELEDSLVLNVFELLAPEIAHADAVRKVVAEQCPRRLGHKNLAAVAGRADPRCTNDVQPEVALVTDRRLTSMEAHPHADVRVVRPLVRRERALRGDGGRDGVARPGEREEERVSLRVDLLAVLGLSRLAQDPALVAENVSVAVAELTHQLR
jgi:hypothetical protein